MGGPRGPKPMPTHLKLLRGNPGHQVLNKNEPQPMLGDEPLPPPNYLDGYAKEEWLRLSTELHRLRLLTICDVAALAAYCDAYGRWRDAKEALDRIRANDPTMRGLMIKRESAIITNPLVSSARKAAGDMVRFASEFGLTPAARARIGAGPYGDSTRKNKFGGLLAS